MTPMAMSIMSDDLSIAVAEERLLEKREEKVRKEKMKKEKEKKKK